MLRSVLFGWLAAAGTVPAVAAGASSAQAVESWAARIQATYVHQHKDGFPAAYSGPRSLGSGSERSYSFTTTVALAWRPWRHTELHLQPEAAQGVPLSGLAGLGGFTNGEIARTAGPSLSVYRARAFVRHTWPLAGPEEPVAATMTRLGDRVARRRLVLTAGNLAVTDLFDDNAFAHDARSQFLNWALITHGAYDFAADARGYTWGAALEYVGDGWTVRAGRFAQPRIPNLLPLDRHLDRHYGDQIEVEWPFTLGERPGRWRVLAFRNQVPMATYADALAAAGPDGVPADLARVRLGRQSKRGVGVNLEQSLGDTLGLFLRTMWADGRTETYAFTSIDRSVSFGLVADGAGWGRVGDTAGLGFAWNGLSLAHRRFLAAGGVGFFLGDGRLNYRPEQVVEAFYRWRVLPGAWVSLDWQRLTSPGYNADRGPVDVLSLRWQFAY